MSRLSAASSFFIRPLFLDGCCPGGDESNGLNLVNFAARKDDKDDYLCCDLSERVVAFFLVVMRQILAGKNPRVLKDELRRFKTDSVLAKVLSVLGRIPIESAHPVLLTTIEDVCTVVNTLLT